MLNNVHSSFPDAFIDWLLNAKHYEDSKVSNLNPTDILTWFSECGGQYHYNVERATMGEVIDCEKISQCGHLFQTWGNKSLPGEIIKYLKI